MNISIQRRAEIALRSLDKIEQERIIRSLSDISAIDQVNLSQEPKLNKLRKLVTGFSGKKLYVYQGSPNLRLILSFEGDTCTVEDIVDHDRLSWLVAQRGRNEKTGTSYSQSNKMSQ
jgi:hypothetical protein